MAIMQGSAVVGVFNERADADRAVDDLVRNGYRRDQIGVIARGDESSHGTTTMIGAATGAGVAGLVSLGMSFGVIPVIGPIMAVGPLAAALISAAGGAVAAGLVGALMDWGVSEEEAEFYEKEVKAGRFVVTIHDVEDYDKAWDILHRGGAYSYSQNRQ